MARKSAGDQLESRTQRYQANIRVRCRTSTRPQHGHSGGVGGAESHIKSHLDFIGLYHAGHNGRVIFGFEFEDEGWILGTAKDRFLENMPELAAFEAQPKAIDGAPGRARLGVI